MKHLLAFFLILIFFAGSTFGQKSSSSISQSPEDIRNIYQEYNHYSETNDLITDGQDSLNQAANKINEKTDSLSKVVNSTVNHPIDTLASLSSYVQDTLRKALNSIDKSLNETVPRKSFSEIHPLFPGSENYNISDLSDRPPLSPLQTELGEQKLSLPDWIDKQENILQKVDAEIPDPNLPTGSMPDVNVPGQQSVDQLIDNQAGKLDAVQELQQQSGKTFGQADELKSMGNDVQQYGDLDQMDQMGKSAVNEEAIKKMNELFDQHSDKLEEAQNLMSNLKKKYSYVPNSNDLSTARKASSLEGEPLKKRLTVGGNFKFERGNPLSLDLSPYVLYKINKEFYTGVSASYRFRISYEPKTYATHAEDVVGGSVIVRHKVYKGFFGYSEFEYRSAPVNYDSLTTSETIYKRKWVPGLLLVLS